MSRRILQAVLLVLAVSASIWAQAPAGAASAPVVAVQPGRVADLVMLGEGFGVGFRQGMVCRVTRGAAEIAEILLVDLRPAAAAALILNVAPRQAIRAGDVATAKIIKT